jgi:hypothetical protein
MNQDLFKSKGKRVAEPGDIEALDNNENSTI